MAIKNGINVQVPPSGVKGQILGATNGVGGKLQTSGKLPSKKVGSGNAAGFRSTAAKSMMR